jgi:predicted DNA-binding protein with PD1-like motif
VDSRHHSTEEFNVEWESTGSELFVRIDPGEPLVATIGRVAAQVPFRLAVITSGVGMIRSARLGFFDTGLDGYVTTDIRGVHDVSAVTGNVVPRNGVPAAHLHMIVNDGEHTTRSGHVVEAYCHLTMELFLRLGSLDVRRVATAGLPASRIVRNGGDHGAR